MRVCSVNVPARDVFWSALEASVSAGFSVVSAFVVARLVGPAEVGVGAAGVAMHVLLWVGVNALFADAIVQRSALDDDAASSAFWASVLVGVGAALVQVAAGWPLAWALADRRLIWMSLVLAVPLPLVGAAGVIQGRATRQRGYRLLACRALVGQSAGTAVGIGCALGGAGAWALVAQQAAGSAVGALVLLLGAGWRPTAVCRWGPVRELLRVGGPLAASTVVLHGRYRMFAVLVGSTAGAATLGEVHMAFRLVDTVRELVFTALWRLMLPDMAERQGDPAALRKAVDRWLGLAGLVAFPLCGAMLVSVQPLIALLLGPAWAPSGRAALPLVGLAAWLFLVFPCGVAAVARGAPQYALRGNVMSFVALALGVALLRPSGAVAAAAIWLAAQAVATPYTLRMNARVLGCSVWASVRAGLPALALAVAASGAALEGAALLVAPGRPAEVLVARLLIGAAVAGPGAAMLIMLGRGGRATPATRRGGSAGRRLRPGDAGGDAVSAIGSIRSDNPATAMHRALSTRRMP